MSKKKQTLVLEKNWTRITKQVPPTDEHYKYLEHFEQHGWVIFPNVIPLDLVKKAKQEIRDSLLKISSFDTQDSSTWKYFPFFNNGFCEFYHLPSFYEMRFYPPLYTIFCKLYNTHKILCTIDRCCVKRPLYTTDAQGKKVTHEDWYHKGFIHHDKNLITGECPIPIQCVISLDDTASNQGGWQGIDQFHEVAESWVKHAPDSYKQKLNGSGKLPFFFPDNHIKHFEDKIVHPQMGPGDVMVWHANVAHGSAPNESIDKLRFAAYINFVDAASDNLKMRQDYITCWQTGKHPGRFDDKYSKLEMNANYKPYPIETPLQERILGIVPWEDQPLEE